MHTCLWTSRPLWSPLYLFNTIVLWTEEKINRLTQHTSRRPFASENSVYRHKRGTFSPPESKFFWSGTNHLRDGSRCPNNAAELEWASLFVVYMFSFFHSKLMMIVVSRPVHPHCQPELFVDKSLLRDAYTRRVTLRLWRQLHSYVYKALSL